MQLTLDELGRLLTDADTLSFYIGGLAEGNISLDLIGDTQLERLIEAVAAAASPDRERALTYLLIQQDARKTSV
jgi:hypothetical protein